MTDRYFNKASKTELLTGLGIPTHLLYDSENPDHVAIDESNPFFHSLPEGKQIEYSGDLPIGIEDIPDTIYTVEEQATIDLRDTNVSSTSLTLARYLDGRGDSSLLTAIDGLVDDVVLSSGLTLAEVVELIR